MKSSIHKAVFNLNKNVDIPIEGAISELKKYSRGVKYQEIDIAISALEKQIPKAPIDDPEAWLCPNCKSWVSHEQQRMYCRQCGQLIAWDKI